MSNSQMLYKDKPWIDPYETKNFTPKLPPHMTSTHGSKAKVQFRTSLLISVVAVKIDSSLYGINRAGFNTFGYKTTANDYGKYPPTKAMLPTSYHPRNIQFTAVGTGGPLYRKLAFESSIAAVEIVSSC